MAQFAKALAMDHGALRNYMVGDRTPGPVMQAKLRALGCDIEWLMTGNEGESVVPIDPELERCMEVLRSFGIRNAAQLRAMLEENKKLRGFIGTEAYAAFTEAAAVMEKRSHYATKRKRTDK